MGGSDVLGGREGAESVLQYRDSDNIEQQWIQYVSDEGQQLVCHILVMTVLFIEQGSYCVSLTSYYS